jgi:hypothetical protein
MRRLKGERQLWEGHAVMADTEAARHKGALAQKHIAEQRQRIAQHRELIATLKRDDQHDLLPAARELLADLERVLARMIAERFHTYDECAVPARRGAANA